MYDYQKRHKRELKQLDKYLMPLLCLIISQIITLSEAGKTQMKQRFTGK